MSGFFKLRLSKKPEADDDLDFNDDYDDLFGNPEVENNRSPVTKVALATGEGFAKEYTPSKIVENIAEYFPQEYGQGVDFLSSGFREVTGAISDTVDQVKPVFNLMARAGKYFLPTYFNRLHDRLDRLEQWSSKASQNSGRSIEAERDESIKTSLQTIFSQQAELLQIKDQIKEEKDEAREKVRETANYARHFKELQILNEIYKSTTTTSIYTTKITSEYQKKSLELKYRMLFVNRDMLTSLEKSYNANKTLLENIVKNTGLPEFVKIQTSEAAKSSLRNKFFDSSFDTVKNYGSDLWNNTKKTVKDNVDDFVNAVLMTETMLDTTISEEEMMGKKTLGQRAGGLIGGKIGKELRQFALHMILHEFRKDKEAMEGVLQGSNWLGYSLNNIGQRVKDLKLYSDDGGLQDEAAKEGKFSIRKVLGNVINFLDPDKGVDTKLNRKNYKDYNQPAIFSNRVKDSITDIIPGYLARILREITVLRTNNEETPLTIYDYKRNKFTNSKTLTRLVRMESKAGFDNVKDLLSTLTAYSEDEKDRFTEKERKELQSFYLKHALDGYSFNIKKMMDPQFLSEFLDMGLATKVSEFYKNTYSNMDEVEYQRRQREIAEIYNKIPGYMPDNREYAQFLVDVGQEHIARNANLLDKRGNYNFDEQKIIATNNSKIIDPIKPRTKEEIEKANEAEMRYRSDELIEMEKEERKTGETQYRFFNNLRKNIDKFIQVIKDIREEAKKSEEEKNDDDEDIIPISKEDKEKATKDIPRMKRSDAKKGGGEIKVENGIEWYKDKDGKVYILTDDNDPNLTTSDILAKQDITPTKKYGFLDKLKKINIKEWIYKKDHEADDGGQPHIGPMAQQLNDLYGSSVAPDGGTKIDLVNMNGILTATVKELNEKVDSINYGYKQYGYKQSNIDTTINTNVKDYKTTLLEQIRDNTKNMTVTSLLNLSLLNGLDLTKLNLKKIDIENIFKDLKDIQIPRFNTQFNFNDGTIKGNILSLVDNVLSLAGAGLDAGLKVTGYTAKGLMGAAKWIYNKPIKGAIDYITDSTTNTFDIYIGDEKVPRIIAKNIRKGYYVARDNPNDPLIERKDFESVNVDIVSKLDGDTVITVDELQKMRFRYVATDKVINAAKWTINRIKDAGMLLTTGVVGTAMLGFDIAKAVTKTVFELVDPPTDVYVAGEITPRLFKHRMMAGGYYDKHSGQTIERPSQITGEVMDTDGNLVLSIEDFRKGLVNAKGEPFDLPYKKIIKSAWNLNAKTLQMVGKAGKFVLDAGLTALAGAATLLTNGLNGLLGYQGFNFNYDLFNNKEQIELLTAIRDILDSRLPGKKYRNVTENTNEVKLKKDESYLSFGNNPIGPNSSLPNTKFSTQNGIIINKKLFNNLGNLDKNEPKVEQKENIFDKGLKLLQNKDQIKDTIKDKVKSTISNKFNIFNKDKTDIDLNENKEDKEQSQDIQKNEDKIEDLQKENKKQNQLFLDLKKEYEDKLKEIETNIQNHKNGITNSKVTGKNADGTRVGSWQSMEERENVNAANHDKELDEVKTYATKNTFDLIFETVGKVKNTVLGLLGLGDEGGSSIAGDIFSTLMDKFSNTRLGRLGKRLKGKLGKFGIGRRISSIASKIPGIGGLGGIATNGLSMGGQILSKVPGMTTVGSLAKGAMDIGGSVLKTGAGMAWNSLTFGRGLSGAISSASTGLGLLGKAVPVVGGLVGAGQVLGGVLNGDSESIWSGVKTAGLSLAAPWLLKGAGAVIGTLGLPLIAKAAAIGAAGYGIYKAFKWFTKKEYNKLELLRFYDYGVGKDQTDFRDKVYNLEKMLEKIVKVSDNEVDIDTKKLDAQQVYKIFDIKVDEKNPNNERKINFDIWFKDRFIPIYKTWVKAVYKEYESTNLDKLEKKDTKKHLAILEMVKQPTPALRVTQSPLPGYLSNDITNREKYIAALKAEMEKEGYDKGKLRKAGEFLLDRLTPYSYLKKAYNKSKDYIKDKFNQGKENINKLMENSFIKSLGSKITNSIKSTVGFFAGIAKGTMDFISSPIQYLKNFFTKDKTVTPLEAIKMKAYGLVELDKDKVKALRSLEEFIGEDIIFNNEGVVELKTDLTSIASYAQKIFGIDKNEENIKNLVKWLSNRFIPTFLLYYNGLNAISKKQDFKLLQMSQDSTHSGIIDIVNAIIGNDSIWSTMSSPWSGYTLSSIESSKIKENKEYLLSIIKKEKHKDHTSSKTEVPKEPNASNNKNEKPLEDLVKQASEDKETKKESTSSSNLDNSNVDTFIKAANNITVAIPKNNLSTNPNTIDYQQQPEAEVKPKETGLSNKVHIESKPITDTENSNVVSSNNETKSTKTDSDSKIKEPNTSVKQTTKTSKYIKLNNSGVNIKNMNPDFMKLFNGMVDEYGEKTGRSVLVTSGWRSIEKQRQLYKTKPKGQAAAPGKSLHEFGLALDVNTPDLDALDKLGLLKKYGFTRPITRESWHIEPVGFNTPDIVQKVKTDSKLASERIQAGIGRGGGGVGSTMRNVKYYRRDWNNHNKIFNATVHPEKANLDKNNTGYKSGIEKLKNEQINLSGGESSQGGVKGIDSKQSVPTINTRSNIKTESQPSIEVNSQTLKDNNGSVSWESLPNKGGAGWNNQSKLIEQASQLVGIDTGLAANIAAIESDFRPGAIARSSEADYKKARGLYQMKPDVFNEMVKKYGNQYGITKDNANIMDPRQNTLMGLHYVKQGLQKTKADQAGWAYMTHFLGQGSNLNQFVKLGNNDYPATVLEKPAKYNKNIFYHQGDINKPRTKAEILQYVESIMIEKGKRHGVDKEIGKQLLNQSTIPTFTETKIDKPTITKDTKESKVVVKNNDTRIDDTVKALDRLKQNKQIQKQQSIQPKQVGSDPSRVLVDLDTTNTILTKQVGLLTEIRDLASQLVQTGLISPAQPMNIKDTKNNKINNNLNLRDKGKIATPMSTAMVSRQRTTYS